MAVKWQIHLIRGPLDGAKIRLSAGFEPPSEIVFRNRNGEPAMEAIYRQLLGFTFDANFANGILRYCHWPISELTVLAREQAERIQALENEREWLLGELAKANEKYERHRKLCLGTRRRRGQQITRRSNK